MINPLHLVLRNRPDSVELWSDAEVALRCASSPRRDEATGELAEPDEHDLALLFGDADRVATSRAAVESVVVHEVPERVGRSSQFRGGVFRKIFVRALQITAMLDEQRFWHAASMSISTRFGLESSLRRRNRNSRRGLTAFGPGLEPRWIAFIGREGSLETSDRPDAWLCELTLQETEFVPRTGQAESSPASLSETAQPDEPIVS